MQAAPQKVVNRAAPTVQRRSRPAASVVPARAAVPPGAVQLAGTLKVSSPADSAEREAEQTAQRVMRTPDARPLVVDMRHGAALPARSPYVARFAGHIVQRDRLIARKATGAPAASANVAAEIQASQGGGTALPDSVRSFMEPRFGARFDKVRIHAGERAARLSRQLSARAFTVGNQIFFGRDQFQPESQEGRELIAHELTHTIQQGAVSQTRDRAQTPTPRDGLRPSAPKFGLAVQRSWDRAGALAVAADYASVPILSRGETHVQRLGIGDALDYFADKANLIPGYRMFTIVLGVNPINMSRVERGAANVLRAIVEFIPGGGLIVQALDRHGIFDRVGNWIEAQLRTLGLSGASIRQAVDRFLDSLSWRDIFDLSGVWARARRIITEPIDRIIAFASGLAGQVIRFIKDAILRPLAQLAQGTRGYDLLRAVLGNDPITGDPAPRNAETLIGGFMKLIGEEEVWNNLKRANAIPRAWAWFQGALSGLVGFVRQIPAQFLAALRQLELADILLVPRAFARIASVFGGFVGRFLSWAGQQVLSLLQIIFAVVAPGVMPYVRRAAGAFRTIIQNPIAFVRNLVRAGTLGFRQFAGNFLAHLRAALIGWLTGTMSGANIYIPQAFTVPEIVKFVLSVLGLTWQNLRAKLVRAVGETAVRAMETGFDIVVTLVAQGPASAWEKIQESLSNLREMVMEQIMTFVRDRVVQAAITRLVTSLNPAGAFIQAIIATYNTIMFFVERLRQIAQVAMSFIDSIAAIASGVVAAAANRVERTMAGLLTLVVSFLARIAGLGKVSDAVASIVNRIRAPIDRALDRIVDWIVAMARRLGRFVAQAGLPQDPRERLRLGLDAAVTAVDGLQGAVVTESFITPVLTVIRVRYGFQTLRAIDDDGDWWIEAVINPVQKKKSAKKSTRRRPSPLANQQADLERLVAQRPPMSYPLDALSRPAVPTGFVRAVKSGDARDSMTSKFMPGYQPGDQKGHLIGDRFHGPGEPKNLVPMAPTLNLSTYKQYENLIASDYLALEAAKRPVLLKMTATPAYPVDDSLNNASYRPSTVTLVGEIHTLKAGITPATLERKTHNSGALPNPSPVVTALQVNGDTQELKAAIWVLTRPRIANPDHVHRLINAVVAARREGRFTDVDGFRLRLAITMGSFAFLISAVEDSEIQF